MSVAAYLPMRDSEEMDFKEVMMRRMNLKGRTRRSGWIAALTLVGFGIGVALGAAIVLQSDVADAQSFADETSEKEYWQARYRGLRLQEARLKKTIELATKEYADSNRRSYRRSGVRHFHRANAHIAKEELAKVRGDLVQIYDDARLEEVPLTWLYEVEDEKIDPSQVTGLGDYANERGFLGSDGTSADGPEEGGDSADDAGRNPIHLRDETPPASPNEAGAAKFEYDAWQADPDKYESRSQGN